jgi:hypothetical protein
MTRKLSDALKSRYENVPESFENHVDAALQALIEERTEPTMRRKTALTAILIAALLLATMGVALALSSMGILDFRKEDTGKEATKQAAELVQRDLKNNVLQLGDCTVTVKEVMSDGFSGNLLVEYRLPEGMYLYTPDARAPGTYHSIETETVEELLEKYEVLYMPLDEHVGFWVDGAFEYPNSEVGFDPVKVADNVMIVNIGFDIDKERMDEFVHHPGVRKITGPGEEDFERIRNEPIYLGDFADTKNNVLKTADAPEALAKAGVESIDVVFTPLSMLVDLTFNENVEATYSFIVVDEKGMEIESDFISCFVGSEGWDGKSWTKGYTAPDTIPETLDIQLFERVNDEDVPMGGVVRVTLK